MEANNILSSSEAGHGIVVLRRFHVRLYKKFRVANDEILC